MKAKVKLHEGMQFVGSADSGHGVLLDSVPDHGGSDTAAHPVEMVLMALGGCTSMDVISILEKMKQELRDYEVIIDAARAESHPRVLTEVGLTYRLWGNIEEKKLVKAIELSLDKYCSVANMLKPEVDMDYDYEILG